MSCVTNIWTVAKEVQIFANQSSKPLLRNQFEMFVVVVVL